MSWNVHPEASPFKCLPKWPSATSFTDNFEDSRFTLATEEDKLDWLDLFIFLSCHCGGRGQDRKMLPSLAICHVTFYLSLRIMNWGLPPLFVFTCACFYTGQVVSSFFCKYSVTHKSQNGKEKIPTHSETVYWTLFSNYLTNCWLRTG